MQETITQQRAALIRTMAGHPAPRLWCPPLTHYAVDGSVDVARMRAHWRSMVGSVGGFLVPGSTGDGWEMTEVEIAQLVETAIGLAMELDTRLLVGVLQTDVAAMVALIRDVVERLVRKTEQSEVLAAMRQCNVTGFTICPPSGASLTQPEIREALARVLDLGLPVALYQLPQITENEVSPAAFADLAAHYANLVMFKDTSGEDRVALADAGRSGVMLMRGAEGNYAGWLREAGGCYQGFLLSTANCFAGQLERIVKLTALGAFEDAQALSARLTAAVGACFEAVARLQGGNAFSNANRAVDHHMAFGPHAADVEPPLLHSGSRLPVEVIRAVGRILEDNGLAPARGYLA